MQSVRKAQPNKRFHLTPLRGHKIGAILKSRIGPLAFPIKNGGAA
jgi:hypothetical protein